MSGNSEVALAKAPTTEVTVDDTLMYLINVQSVITVQGFKFSERNKRTGRKILQ